MPITRDRFDRIGEESVRLDDDAERILEFLVRNEDKAYTQSEIADETGVERENVGPALERLKQRKSVERKSDYWRVSDHELTVRSGTALTSETARRYDDGDGFDVEKWAEYAVDESRTGETE